MSSDVQLPGNCDSSQSAGINGINGIKNREREGHTLNDLVQAEDGRVGKVDVLAMRSALRVMHGMNPFRCRRRSFTLDVRSCRKGIAV